MFFIYASGKVGVVVSLRYNRRKAVEKKKNKIKSHSAFYIREIG